LLKADRKFRVTNDVMNGISAVSGGMRTFARKRARPLISSEHEEHRDTWWRREGARHVETALQAERFIDEVGFAACLTDSRRPGPSLYVAVCGRRDAVMPRNVQKDPEASQTWLLKDEVLRRGKVYYGKLARGKATFLAPRMIPYFNAIWGVRPVEEPKRLSRNARRVLRVLRHEWEMATSDLRKEIGITDRATLTRAIDELQAAMLVVPSEVVYQPFTSSGHSLLGAFPPNCANELLATWRCARSHAASSPALA
jgi:hypothetical protein